MTCFAILEFTFNCTYSVIMNTPWLSSHLTLLWPIWPFSWSEYFLVIFFISLQSLYYNLYHSYWWSRHMMSISPITRISSKMGAWKTKTMCQIAIKKTNVRFQGGHALTFFNSVKLKMANLRPLGLLTLICIISNILGNTCIGKPGQIAVDH